MSVEARALTRFYGAQCAVREVTFSIRAGEVVGFLGPNGAGKSTTMKMLTGFLDPSDGSASVAGFDISSHPLEARASIGYLPEHNPMYLDMYVHEFLEYSGSLYGLKGSRLRDRVKDMVHRCGLTREQNKRLEALSRGYRQRVGLAQALLHDPKVLILDEPTSGLDPNQIEEIRDLIRDVSREKTVLLSTHIMQEVQAICQRVLIISSGRLVADDTLAGLLVGDVQVLVAEFSADVSAEMFGLPAGAEAIEAAGARRLRIRSAGGDIRQEVIRHATVKGFPLVGLTTEEIRLEDRFRELTADGNNEISKP